MQDRSQSLLGAEKRGTGGFNPPRSTRLDATAAWLIVEGGMSSQLRGAASGAATALASANGVSPHDAVHTPSGEAPAPAQRASAAGLEALYRHHAAWLVSALRRRFGREQAEDLSQEAFARAARYAKDQLQSPRALLMTLASRAALERRRQAGLHAPDAAAPAELHDEQLWDEGPQESLVLLKQVILALPPKLREVFVLSRFQGLTYDQIGRRCGISTKTVEWRMSRALAICAARMRD